MRTLSLLLAAAAAATLAACAHPVDTAGAPDFGASLEAMRTAQAISPQPESGQPEGSGAVGAAAQGRYKGGATRPLLSTATSATNPGR